MLAIVKTNKKGEAVSIFGTAVEGGWANLPDGSMISPAEVGVSGDGYKILKIADSEIPEGQLPTGERSVQIVDGVPTWVQSTVAIPQYFPTLTHRQFWLTAWDVGITKESLRAKILSTYPEEERGRAALEVELATSFERNHSLVDELCVASGITPSELDSLWLWAYSI